MTRPQSIGRSLVRILIAEFVFRHLIGFIGLAWPTAGATVQRGLLAWGVIASILCIRLLARTEKRYALTSFSVLFSIAISTILRLPPDLSVFDSVVTALLTWCRLTIPVAGLLLFQKFGAECIAYADELASSIRSRSVTWCIVLSTFILAALRLASNSAWAWSPQQPAPYLIIGALGSAGSLTLAQLALFAAFAIASLKRSATIGFIALLIVAPKRVNIRRSADVTRLVAMMLGGTSILIGLGGTNLGGIVVDRFSTGIEQLNEQFDNNAASNSGTSLDARDLETAVVLSEWEESVSTILFGVSLRDLEAGSRRTLAVHNTYVSVLTLGGAIYVTILPSLVAMTWRTGSRRCSHRYYRWYRAAAVAVLVEALAGNALLTLSFPAAIMLLFCRYRSADALHIEPTKYNRTPVQPPS